MSGEAELNKKLERLYRSIQTAIEADQTEQVLHSTKELLRLNPEDELAKHVRAVALIRNSQFSDALTLLPPKLRFEQAYCHYRNNSLGLCSPLLSSLKQQRGDDEPLLHLEAQVLYRSGAFEKSAEIYEKHFKQHLSERDPEILTNLLASYASAGKTDKTQKFDRELKSNVGTYEIAYNIACALIEDGDLSTAKQRLEFAKELCLKSLKDEELSEEEVQDELSFMKVQLGYIYQLQNQLSLAMETYAEVLNAKPSDAAVLATASNNLISLRKKEEKVFDSIKKIEKATKVPEHKLSHRQRLSIQLNRCLLSFYAKKNEQCQEILESIEKEFPQTEVTALIRAAIHFRNKGTDDCVHFLLDQIKQRSPDHRAQLELTLAHLYLTQGKLQESVQTLEGIQSLKHQLAWVATVVALYDRLDQKQAAAKVFDAAVQFWESNKEGHAKRNLSVLLEKSAEFKLKNGMVADAVKLYERLSSESKQDPLYLSNIVTASAKVDVSLAEKYAAKLPKLAGANQVDVKSLEAAPAPRAPLKRSASASKEKNSDEPVQKKPKQKKKKKKIRYPKNFDPANPGPPPDPERWLPKWQRTTIAKKGRRKRTNNNERSRGPQGAVVSAAEENKLNIDTMAPTAQSPSVLPTNDERGVPRNLRSKMKAPRKKRTGKDKDKE